MKAKALVILAGLAALVAVLAAWAWLRNTDARAHSPRPLALAPGGALEIEAESASSSSPAPGGHAEGTDTAPLSGDEEPLGPQAALPSNLGSAWLARNKAGIEALERGDAKTAVGLFEACVEAQPDEPIFARNLAIALDAWARQQQESDLEAERMASIESLARAIELYPGEDDSAQEVRLNLEQRLARWRASGAAEAEFLDDGHIHFQLSYDGSSPGLRASAPWILEQLESAYLEFGEYFTRFPVEEGRGRIRVVLMDRAQFDAATGLGDWAGGAFDGTVRIPAEDVESDGARRRLAKVLRHELCHAFVRAVGGQEVPGWLNEGLSQRLELDSPGKRSLALQVAKAQLQGHDLFPLAELEGSLASWDNPGQIGRAYAQSFAFLDYIESQYGLREVLEMVLACGAGKSPDQAIQERVGVPLSVLLGDFAETLSR